MACENCEKKINVTKMENGERKLKWIRKNEMVHEMHYVFRNQPEYASII